MAAYIFDLFPVAVRAVAARCKLPFAIRPGLSQERTNEMTNERRKTFSVLFRRCHKGRRGKEQGFLNLGAYPLSLCSALLLSFSPLLELPFRRLALRVLLSLSRDQPPYIRSG
jgi:hypothetical protein